MLTFMTRAVLTLALLPGALAQSTVPATPPAPISAPTTAPAELDRPLTPRVTLENARLTATATPGAGTATVRLSVQNTGTSAFTLNANRDSLQGCQVAPHVRVLKVGSREVVYPDPAGVRLCAQDIVTREVPAGGSVEFARNLTLPAGEYLVEVWFQGFVGEGGERVRVAAEAVRVRVQ
ncbi:hypothetical protein [Deinococcus maricopensis]|nr:hypothetical protein [Deinococcus maricopensis]